MYKVVLAKQNMGTDTYVMSPEMLKTLIDETFQIPGFDCQTVTEIVQKEHIYCGSHAGKQITVTKELDLHFK